MLPEPLQLPTDGRAVPADAPGDLGISQLGLFLMEDAESIVFGKMGVRHCRPGPFGV